MYSSFEQIAVILSVTRSTVRSEGSADARSRCLPRRTHSNPCEMTLWQGDRSLWGSGVRGRSFTTIGGLRQSSSEMPVPSLLWGDYGNRHQLLDERRLLQC